MAPRKRVSPKEELRRDYELYREAVYWAAVRQGLPESEARIAAQRAVDEQLRLRETNLEKKRKEQQLWRGIGR